MKQLTLRGFDDELARRVERVARQRNVSLNKAVLHLLRLGAGLERPPQPRQVVGDTLDDFVGSWSGEREREVLEAVEVFERVDETFWS